MNDGVVLLHGIFRTHRSMGKLARFLEQNGYKVLNLGYPSTRYSLEDLVEHIHPQIKDFLATVEGNIHFVGYSMGGLLLRAYMTRYRPERLGRVVMMGVPNHGSEVADFIKGYSLYRYFYGPAGQQLVTDQQEFTHVLGTVDYDVGAIAGNRTLDPVSSYIIGKPNDGKVSVESAKVNGMRDFVVIPVTHTFFPSNKRAMLQALSFLRTGKFIQAPTS